MAVVRPGCTEEVAAVVALCRGAGVAVVPQGGDTGLCGGAVPDTSGALPDRPVPVRRGAARGAGAVPSDLSGRLRG